jgi:hypothetical protein
MDVSEGGSIPKRSEMVKTKKKDVVLENSLKLAVLWLSCALSREPLRVPVVSDGLGRLFNRESVLELLVSGKTPDPSFANIKSLKVCYSVSYGTTMHRG